MVTPITTDSFEIRKSLTSPSIGNDIDLTASGLINLNTDNNLWTVATGAETIAGSNKYRTFFIRYIGPSSLNSLHLNLLQATKKTGYTDFKWAFDPSIPPQYKWGPHRSYNGSSDFDSIADAAPLRLTQFSVAIWFRTSFNFSTIAFMINKGGTGSDTAGQNDNYSIKMDSTEHVVGGFEEGNGTDHYITSPLIYNDGKWHLAVLTYDQSNLRLYIDGVEVTSTSTSVAPESSGTNPLVLGRNSRASDSFYGGDLDEAYVWNNDLTPSEVKDLWDFGTIPQPGNIVYGNRFPGIAKKYKYFDGVDDNILVPDSSALDLVQFSLSFWFRTTKNFSGGTGVMVSKGRLNQAGDYLNYSVRFATSNAVRGIFETSGGSDNQVDSPSTSLNDGKWHHCVLTYDQINLRLYIDSVNVATTATTSTPNVNTQSLSIASAPDNQTFFEGDLGEVYVWNNDLLSAEVTQIYRGELVPQQGNMVYSMTAGFDNIILIPQTLTNENTAPIASPVWNSESPIIPEIPNIGTMAHFQYIPIIGWWSNIANSPDIEDDFVQLNLNYALPSGQTGGGGSGGDPQTPPSNTSVTVIHGGDWGEETTTEEIVTEIVAANPTIIIDSGDKAYASSPSEFFSIVASIKSKMLDSQGNHDTGSTKETAYLNEAWAGQKHYYNNTKAFYYYRILENIAFICFDTEESFGSGSTQKTAMTQFFQEIKALQNIDWIFVFFHRPPFGSATDHGYNEGNLVQNYFPSWDSNKVDFICCAHNHNYERTYPVVYNPDNATNPTITDATAGPYVGGQGRIVIRNGTFGHDQGTSLYKFSGSQPAYTKYRTDDDNGIVKFVFSNNNKTCTVSFVNLDGQTLDTFVVNK